MSPQLLTKDLSDFFHIYGYQDNNTPNHLRLRPSQLNIIVDNLSQVQFDNSHENSKFTSNVLLHHEGDSVKIGGVKLQDKLLTHIRKWVVKRKLSRHLLKKILCPVTDFHTLILKRCGFTY